jgi:hypothetical protein
VPVLSKDETSDTDTSPTASGGIIGRIRHAYGKAPCLTPFRLSTTRTAGCDLSRLSEVNVLLLRRLCLALGVRTPMVFLRASSEELDQMDSSARLARLPHSRRHGHLSGPSARAYSIRILSPPEALSFVDYSAIRSIPSHIPSSRRVRDRSAGDVAHVIEYLLD